MQINKDDTISLSADEFDTIMELIGDWEEECEAQHSTEDKDTLVTNMVMAHTEKLFKSTIYCLD